MAEFLGKVLLVGNYFPDQQESMQRFAQMLSEGLRKRGVNVELLRPEPVFGKFLRSKWFGYADKFLVFPRRLKPADVLHICDHSNAIYTKYGGRNLVTCHDMLAIRSARGEFPENRTGPTGRILQGMILRGLNRAGRVACVSKATLKDFRKLSKASATVIENGLNFDFRPVEAKKSERYILHVGGNQWYKNRSGVIGIYRELVKLDANAPELVLVGKELPLELENAARGMRVRSVLGCSNEELRALYSGAEALLFPSLAEGFGWPVVEAQACGCPVVTSNFEPLTEVGGDAAAYVDPRDHPSAARVLRGVLMESESEKKARREKGFVNVARFSAEKMIDRYIDEYARVAAGR